MNERQEIPASNNLAYLFLQQVGDFAGETGSNCLMPQLHRLLALLRIVDLKELGTSRTHSAVIRCLTICQHIPVVRKNHKNQLTQQFDIICCLARCLALCIESKQIMSLLSCESATLKRGPQLCGQRCGAYFDTNSDTKTLGKPLLIIKLNSL